MHSIFMSDGVSSRLNSSKEKSKRRIKASQAVQSLLGISSTHYLNLPDNSMDSVPLIKIVQKLEPIIHKINPSIVYTHSYGDLNIDHRLTHAAVMTACRPIPDSTVREIYGFEVISSTEWASPQHLRFEPTLFVDITKFVTIKTQGLKLYKDEMRPSPHSRSIKYAKALAQHRGHTVGVNMAEAFEVYRIIR